MQMEVPTRLVWRRGLLFSAFVAPVLGSLLASTTMIAVNGEPPSILMVLVTAVTVAYVVATLPALLAGMVCISLALHWRNNGVPRRSIVLRLAVAGTVLGAAAAVVAGSLAEGHLVVSLLYLGPGALTGLLMGLMFPRILWA
jgi:hypothetical protein